MVNYCCVPKCNGVGGFSFPEDKHLRKKWRVAVRRVDKKKNLWNPSEHSVVCEKHFEKSDFLETNICGHLRLRKKLRDGIVPTIFSFKTSTLARGKSRYFEREKRTDSGKTTSENLNAEGSATGISERDTDCEEIVNSSEVDFAMEVELSDESEPVNMLEPQISISTNVGVQVAMPNIGCLRVSQFENNPEGISYYTGFKNIQHFRFFFHCLGQATYHLNYKSRSLEAEDELFLCLMKLRQNKGKNFNFALISFSLL